MSRHERTGVRDLTYSAWHRTLDDAFTMIDIDAVEFCCECGAPLALIETARDVGQTGKVTSIMRRLAARAGLPAFLVLYEANDGDLTALRVRQVSPHWGGEQAMTPFEYAELLGRLRETHRCPELTTPDGEGKEWRGNGTTSD